MHNVWKICPGAVLSCTVGTLYTETVFSEGILVLHTSIAYSLVSCELVILHLSLEVTDKAQLCK